MTKQQARRMTSEQIRARLADGSLTAVEAIHATAVLSERRDHGRPLHSR